VIYVGIDDTDIVGSPGTNQLARAILMRLGSVADGAIICRHQLFFDPRVPYTSKNGSASIQLPHAESIEREVLLETVREVMRGWYVEGSDPGLAVACSSTAELAAFAERAKTDIVTQDEARSVAARSGCHLEGLGGTEQGIIGALAAIPLAAGGDDGRVVHLAGWPCPDDVSGPLRDAVIAALGIAEIRSLAPGRPFPGGAVDVGKHLRPNWRGGRIVLFVEPPSDGSTLWRAVKLL
jgi:hypothetical protein